MLLKKQLLFTCTLFMVFTSTAFAAEPYVYPSKGQSHDQMEKDKYECYGWAKQNSGYDPMQQQAAPEDERIVGGAARGAAGGAIIGAIAGDAGKGAAIGAGAGAVHRGIGNRRRDNEYQEQSAHADSEYNRAYSACLRGRGYSVD